MIYSVENPKKFRKSLDRCIKRGLDVSKFKDIVSKLANGEALPDRCRPHKLSGSYAGCWECHIESDWLLIWRQDDEALVLVMVGIGTHSDLF